jgi:MarR family transcriptional regulator, organic hydroperoxide resistance regulator
MTTDTATREETLQQLGTAFRGLMASVRRLKGRDTHRPGELSFAQFHLLFGLAHGGPLSTSQLADAADLAPATVTQMLDGLVAAGLVERTRSTSDRRVVTCALTERGQEIVDQKRSHWEKRWHEALAEFSSDDLAVTAAVLERLRAMYAEIEAP